MKNVVIALLIIYPLHTTGQNQRRTLMWTGSANELHFKKTSSLIEIENSRRLSPSSQDYFTVLINTDYSFKHLRPGIGFSYWLLYNQQGLAIPELRPHVQEEWNRERTRSAFYQRLRLENRFIKDTLGNDLARSFDYVLRPRLMFQINYFLLKKKGEKNSLQFVLSEEFLASFFSRRNGFNENRAYMGLWYGLSKTTSLRLGYMWTYSRETPDPSSDIIYLTVKNDFKYKD